MRWRTAGSELDPTMRFCSARLRTAARARSKPSRRQAAGSGGRADVRHRLGRSATRSVAAHSRTARVAVIEMAEASGLSRVDSRERDPIARAASGTGELVVAAIAAGAKHITLGIGGSATNDGGTGLLRPWGSIRRRRRSAHWRRPPIHRRIGVDPRQVDSRSLACDVSEPDVLLLGPRARPPSSDHRRAPARDRWRPRRTERRLGRRPRSCDRSSRTRDPRRGGRGRRRVRPAGHPGPIQLLRPAARRGSRHGGDRLRRPPGPRGPGRHRGGPDRRPDRIRQDGARRRPTGAGRPHALHRRGWQRGARGDRCPGGRRRAGGPRVGDTGRPRRRDGRGHGPARSVRRTSCASLGRAGCDGRPDRNAGLGPSSGDGRDHRPRGTDTDVDQDAEAEPRRQAEANARRSGSSRTPAAPGPRPSSDTGPASSRSS